MLTNEIVDKWLIALESGDYKQGSCALRRTDDTFCCLGVLCNIVDPDGWTINSDGYRYNHPLQGDQSDQVFGDDVGLGKWGTAISFQSRLTQMNDSGIMTFEDIAEYIRENRGRIQTKG